MADKYPILTPEYLKKRERERINKEAHELTRLERTLNDIRRAKFRKWTYPTSAICVFQFAIFPLTLNSSIFCKGLICIIQLFACVFGALLFFTAKGLDGSGPDTIFY